MHPERNKLDNGRIDSISIQRKLARLGCYHGRIDGVAGEKTRLAISQFQKRVHLVADGIAGPATMAALGKALERHHARKATPVVGMFGAFLGSVYAVAIDEFVAVADMALSAVAWGLGAAALTIAAGALYCNRGLLLGRRT